MSQSRHRDEPQMRTAWVSYATRYTWRRRISEWGQLIFASRGAMTVFTASGIWVVPSHQAVWVPAGVRHDVEVPAGAAMRLLYVRPTAKRRLPATCRAVTVSPLLRELLRRALQLETLRQSKPAERNVMALLLDELALLEVAPIELPMPRDPRALRAAGAVRATPDAPHRLVDVARQANASPRTLERLFRAETGLSFGTWRQRARILRALQLLAENQSVTTTALAVGYESTSAFVAAFRRAIGTTPGQYFKKQDSRAEL